MRALLIALAMLLSLVLPRPASAAHAPHSKPEVRVGILLFDGVQIIDFSAPYEVFGTAGFGVVTISHDGKPVKTAMGLTVTPDHSFADAPAFDVMLIPGGEVQQAHLDKKVLDFVRTRSESARYVLSVCTGAYILGGTGLLDGLKATTFHQALDGLANMYPKVDVVRDVRWADNGKYITSAGLSSGIDAALHLVAKLRGEEKARATALHLEYDWHPEGGFVRTRMADRKFPNKLTSAIAWPKDIAFDQIISIGDERNWRARHRITSSTKPGELLELIARGVETMEGWKRETTPGSYRWLNTADGERTTLAFATYPSETSGAYEIEVTVAVDEAIQ